MDAGEYYMLRCWRQVDVDGVIYDSSWHFEADDQVAARRQFHASCDEIGNHRDRRLELLFGGLWTAAGEPLMFRRPWTGAEEVDDE